MYTWWFYGVAILCLILIPFMPTLVRIRIRILKWLGWQWAVDTLENHFNVWVMIFRVIVFVIAMLGFYFGSIQ
jgi:hypothetical protein